MPAPVLSISGLCRSFNGRRVVDGVDMTVGQGQIVGFLGPNGAGKTSVMTMIMGLLEPDEGRIDLFGEARSARALRRLGYLQEKPSLYPEMSARSYLRLFARLNGVPAPDSRVEAVLDRVGLAAAADRPMGRYSRGMQQRACLGRVMLHEPDFLLLDEPTLGLDPRGVADMRDIFLEMRAGGTTLLFSSHQLAEIERICDSVVFLSQGRVIAAGTPAELLMDTAATGLAVETVEPSEEVRERLAGIQGIADLRATGARTCRMTLADPALSREERRAVAARLLVAGGLTPLSVEARQPGLEDLFLSLAGPRPATGD